MGIIRSRLHRAVAAAVAVYLGHPGYIWLVFKDPAAKLKLHSWLGTYGIVIFCCIRC